MAQNWLWLYYDGDDQCVVSAGSGGAVSPSATFFRSSPNERRTSALTLLTQDELAVWRHGMDKVRQLNRLRRWRIRASASPRISGRMAAGVLGHPAI